MDDQGLSTVDGRCGARLRPSASRAHASAAHRRCGAATLRHALDPLRRVVSSLLRNPSTTIGQSLYSVVSDSLHTMSLTKKWYRQTTDDAALLSIDLVRRLVETADQPITPRGS